jgi:phosphosulfolactate synthase (CoM biosynthesis protein A)
MERLSNLLQLNRRAGKPRPSGLTEIRGPYYSIMGSRYLADVLETMGAYVDSLKFAGGSFCLMPEDRVREIIDVCHRHDVLVSTGGFLERALPLGPRVVDGCLDECRTLGFDTIEVSAGFITAPADDLVMLTVPMSICSSITAKSCSSRHCVQACGARPTSGGAS